MGKMMLSKSVFCVLSGVKINLQSPKISWKIFNLMAFVPIYFWNKLLRIASKNNLNLTLGFWKKNINKFPTVPPGGGGVSVLGKIPFPARRLKFGRN